MTSWQTRTWGLAVTLSLAGVLGAVGQEPPKSAPPADPRLELTPADFKFGEVWQGAECKREFTLKNVGNEPLRLRAESTCGCTVPTQPKSPLEPGESTTISVAYDTKRTGAAHKKVILKQVDTQQVLREIEVVGEVKAVYAMSAERVLFEGLEPNSPPATRSIRLENKYGQPVGLKLGDEKMEGPFSVELKEVEAGQVYELVATTKPPLQKGSNRAIVTLEPTLPGLGSITVNLFANCQPRVITTPMQLRVPVGQTGPQVQTVRVQYQTAKPVKVVDVKTTNGPIEWELMPAQAVPAEAKTAVHQIKVTLPDAQQLPPDGSRLLITTDDPDEYKELSIPIVRSTAATRPATSQPGGRVPLPTGRTPVTPVPTPQQEQSNNAGQQAPPPATR